MRDEANFYTNLKIEKVSEAKVVNSNYSMLQGKRKNISYANLENEKGFQQEMISKVKNKKLKVIMRPNGGFVVKI